MNFVEWDNVGGGFGPSKFSPPVAPPPVNGQTWWHASSDLGEASPQTVKGVTHLGSREAAQHRADVQELNADVHSSVLYGISLPNDLSVLPEAYIENSGQKQMQAFEERLLASDCDVAFTWNTKESEGSWTIIVRRDRLGEIPAALGDGVRWKCSRDWQPGDLYNSVKPLTRR